MGSVTSFRKMKTLTPTGEAACMRLERNVLSAIQEAEEDGLCWGMILATLHQSAYWMHERIQDEE
jgi:hypothetical protein